MTPHEEIVETRRAELLEMVGLRDMGPMRDPCEPILKMTRSDIHLFDIVTGLLLAEDSGDFGVQRKAQAQKVRPHVKSVRRRKGAPL